MPKKVGEESDDMLTDGLQLFLAHGRSAAVDTDSVTIFIRFKVLLNLVVNKSTGNLPAASSPDFIVIGLSE